MSFGPWSIGTNTIAMTIDLTELPLEDDLVVVPSPRTRVPANRTRAVSAIVAATGLMTALVNSSAPVGLGPVDALYRAAFAATVVWFTARSRRWTWPVMAGLAAVATGTLVGQLLAIISLGVSAGSATARTRSRTAGAIVAALSVPALLAQGSTPLVRLTDGAIEDPFGSSAVITMLAVGPAIATG